jgi:beta-aspartyl-peptidase (threonine type)
MEEGDPSPSPLRREGMKKERRKEEVVTGAVVLANDESAAGAPMVIQALSAGRSVLDAVELGIRAVEADAKVDSVGLGGFPNMLGQVECDAALMCGRTLRTGAVGALKGYLHAISVARQVMERTPHVMLVGVGAERFAAEIGAKKCDLLTEEKRAEYEQWLTDHLEPEDLVRWPDVPLVVFTRYSKDAQNARGTSVFLVRDRDGHMAGGVSSSGWMYKYPGRLGDSAVIGAGLYVDDRHGGAACTRTGEMAIRAGTARAVVAYMKKGAAVGEACHEAMDDLGALEGGYAGPVAVHAMDREGRPYVLSTSEEDGYLYWEEGVRDVENRKAVVREIEG